MANSKNKNKSVARIVISRLAGLLIFLIMLFIVNHITIDNYVFNQVVGFLNNNLVLIILMSIIFLIGEIFGALIFPFNLPAPLFNAAGSVFLLTFIFRIFELVKTITKENIFEIFRIFLPFTYPPSFERDETKTEN